MNMLDMHTREQANRIHINKMQQDAKARYLLHQAKQGGNAADSGKLRSLRRTLAFAALLIFSLQRSLENSSNLRLL